MNEDVEMIKNCITLLNIIDEVDVGEELKILCELGYRIEIQFRNFVWSSFTNDLYELISKRIIELEEDE